MKQSALSEMKQYTLFFKFALLFVIASQTLHAQNWNQILKVAAADRENKAVSGRTTVDSFGYSVAMFGDYALVGAFREKEDAQGANFIDNAGAAYLYKLVSGNWTRIKKLTAGDRSSLNYFGSAVALSENYAIVSASETDGRFVYIFKKDEGGIDNWGQVKKIQGAGRGFGNSVSISGDYVVVGSPYDGTDASESNYLSYSGSVYIFKKDDEGPENWGQIKKITAPTRYAEDLFGSSVSISGDFILVGCPRDDWDDTQSFFLENAGSAYFFRKDQGGTDQWGIFKKVNSSQRAKNGYFGCSVAISGGYGVAGAYGEDLNYADDVSEEIGSAYIFKKDEGGENNWARIKRITAPVASKGDRFGRSVAISGDQAIVGADLEDHDQDESSFYNDSGSAYIFRENNGGTANWGLARKLTASVRNNYDEFGGAVAISGDNVIVGVWQEDEDDQEGNTVDAAGAVYIFNKNLSGTENWGFQKKLTASTGAAGGAFYGWSIAIDGNYAVVGAPNERLDDLASSPVASAGAAYVLYNNAGTWKQITKLSASQRNSGANFGISVSMRGDYVVVGAVEETYDADESNPFSRAGAAYIFKRNQGGINNWGLVKKLIASDRSANDSFGGSVSIYGDYLAVGAWSEGDVGNESSSGSVYVFKKSIGGDDGWGQLKKLTPGVRLKYMNFGMSVSLVNELLLVGAPGETLVPQVGDYPNYIGAAYFFEKNFGGVDNWGQRQKVLTNGHSSSSFSDFGRAVATDGNYAIIGASYENLDQSETNFLTNAGAAYVFKKDLAGTGDWVQVKKLVAPSRNAGDRFGSSVALSGNYIVLGAPRKDLSVSDDDRGAVYVFKKDQGGTDQWGLYQQLMRNNGIRDSDYFGTSIGVSGRYLIIGTPGEDEDRSEMNTINDMGASYIFFNADAALPVTLTSFDVKRIEKQVKLSWKTTTEINSDYFEVQKSHDGRQWIALGERVPTVGNAFSYGLTDQNPYFGENLYRLKMVDRDETFAYSRIIGLRFDAESELVVYPNPVSERLYLHDSMNSSYVRSVEVFNDRGQSVLRTDKSMKAGLAVNTLKSGIYIVRIEKTDGEVIRQKVSIVR